MEGTRPGIVAALWLLSVSTAVAQTGLPPAVVRPDISGSIGWLNVNKSQFDSYNDWSNRGVQATAIFGWHWSPHLKTELEASASTRTRFFASGEQLIDGLRAHVASEHAFSSRRVTLGQQYQFGENAWFHPHLAAGVDVNWEKTSRLDREVYFYDVAARQSTIIRRPVAHPDRTDLHVRPFVSAGFKGYVTPRAFIRSDFRIIAGQRIEEAVLRFGFGVDL